MSLANKYRPVNFDEVWEQPQAIRAIKNGLKNGEQAFLFNGPSGCGKTTLARVVAAEIGANVAFGTVEHDAVVNSGVDQVRAIVEASMYGFTEKRCYIIDEVHGLSKQAQDALLKATEEPPPGVYWLLCTTMPTKISVTLKRRCIEVPVKALRHSHLVEYVEDIAAAERWKLAKGVADKIAYLADGSPGIALKTLSANYDANADDITAAVVADEKSHGFKLAQAIAKGAKWSECMGIITALDDGPEGVRIIVINYFASMARNAKTAKDAAYAVAVMKAFGQSFNPTDGKAPLIVATYGALSI